ncbi:MAG: hypothetical protein AB8G18_01855 [Gammaproteobacteria bacterium]
MDLERSDRAARILEFKPLIHSVSGSTTAPLTERLRLDLSRSTARLRRTVTNAEGLESTLSARNTDLSVLLERVLAVPVEMHFQTVLGTPIANSYRCPDDSTKPLILRESRAIVEGLEVVMDARTVIAEPLSVKLTPIDQSERVLPKDLVAVLGHSWTVLRERDDHWKFTVRVPGREPKRSHVARKRFEKTVSHLTQALGNAPDTFHHTYRLARWLVWLRLLTPITVIVCMLGSLPLLDRYVLDQDGGIPTLALGLPNVLILAFMYISRHEIPSMGIPPLPRTLNSSAWAPKTAHDKT